MGSPIVRTINPGGKGLEPEMTRADILYDNDFSICPISLKHYNKINQLRVEIEDLYELSDVDLFKENLEEALTLPQGLYCLTNELTWFFRSKLFFMNVVAEMAFGFLGYYDLKMEALALCLEDIKSRASDYFSAHTEEDLGEKVSIYTDLMTRMIPAAIGINESIRETFVKKCLKQIEEEKEETSSPPNIPEHDFSHAMDHWD